MRKLFTLLTMLLAMFSLNMKAADAVSATQTLSNDSKTCTWTNVIATGSLGNEELISGNGIVLDCKLAKASADGTGQLNVKAGGILYLQVPSADAAGSLKLVGSANDRYFVTNSGTNVYTSKTATAYNFTAADVVTISGKYYLQLTSKSDCKINQGFSITVTSSTAYPEIKEVVQELDAVSVGGVALSDADFNTLKSTKTVTLSDVSYNGVPGCEVTLKEGATGFTRTISEGNVTFAFTLNKTENYTVIVPIEAKEYSGNGVIVAAEAEMNTNDFEVDGIALAMTAADKNFTPGAAKVTIDETPYPCLKLSTGCGVNVTLPEGKVAKKITVYGWSVSNNGKLTQLKESEESEKTVDVASDIFLSGNNKDDIYPSVYTYELDNWESIYFTAAGSPSQPCVVLDIELGDKPAEEAWEVGKTYKKGYLWYNVLSDTRVLVVRPVDGDGNAKTYTTEGYEAPATVVIPAKVSNAGKEYTVEAISADCFLFCNQISSVELHCQYVQGDAFRDCRNIANIIVGDEVKRINECAFRSAAITSIDVNKADLEALQTGSGCAFVWCTNLETITCSSENNYLTVEDNVLYNKDKTKLILFPTKKDFAGFEFTATLTGISPNAFYGNKTIDVLNIPAFISSSIVSYYGAFGATSVTEIHCEGNNIAALGFENSSSLKKIYIGADVKNIGQMAFIGAKNLTDIYLASETTLPKWEYNATSTYRPFKDVTYDNVTLHVVKGMKEKVEAAVNEWAVFTNVVEDVETGVNAAPVVEAASAKVTKKATKNGIIVERNGKKYNVAGQQM